MITADWISGFLDLEHVPNIGKFSFPKIWKVGSEFRQIANSEFPKISRLFTELAKSHRTNQESSANRAEPSRNRFCKRKNLTVTTLKRALTTWTWKATWNADHVQSL